MSDPKPTLYISSDGHPKVLLIDASTAEVVLTVNGLPVEGMRLVIVPANPDADATTATITTKKEKGE